MKNNVRHFFYKKNSKSKSVRKNCFWFEYNNKKYLASYQTIVCAVDENGMFEKYWNGCSVTTLNQIKRFIELFGTDAVIRSDTGEIVTGFSKKEWEGMETKYCDISVYDYIEKYLPLIEWSDRNDYVVKMTYDN